MEGEGPNPDPGFRRRDRPDQQEHTPAATGEIWEIECAITEKKPLLGLWIYKGDRTRPAVMQGQTIVVWTWDAVTKFINSL